MKEKEAKDNSSAEKLNLLIILNSKGNPHINVGLWGLKFDTDELEKAYQNDHMQCRKDGMIMYCVSILFLIVSLVYGAFNQKEPVLTNNLLIPFELLLGTSRKSVGNP
jgi:hypothetical protein